jgi:hypothetical protein
MSNIVTQIDRTTIYTQPIFFVVIVLVNILNISILRSPRLLTSSCSYYFLVYSIISIIHTSCLCPLQLLRHFSTPWTNTMVGCKLQNFVLFTLTFEASLMLVVATFDRFCSSSASARIRSLSNTRTAKYIIVLATLVCIIYISPMLIILYYDENSNLCVQHLFAISYVYTLSQLLVYHILIPVLLLVFGIWTIVNIRQQSRDIGLNMQRIRGRRTDGQLARMLILQVLAHFIFFLPYSITYSINAIIPATRTVTILAIRQLAVPWFQCDYFFFVFLYIFSGSVYRQELIRLVRCHKRHRIVPLDGSNDLPQPNTIEHTMTTFRKQ